MSTNDTERAAKYAYKAVKAPWIAEQVDALNAFQQSGLLHQFTCPGHEGGGDRTLVATRRGWICPHCDYAQDWAHDFMFQKREPISALAIIKDTFFKEQN